MKNFEWLIKKAGKRSVDVYYHGEWPDDFKMWSVYVRSNSTIGDIPYTNIADGHHKTLNAACADALKDWRKTK